MQDSVIDSSLADASEVDLADWPPGERAVTVRCPHGDETRRAVRRLDKMLLRLQTELRARRIEQSTLTLTSQVMTGQKVRSIRISADGKASTYNKVSTALLEVYKVLKFKRYQFWCLRCWQVLRFQLSPTILICSSHHPLFLVNFQFRFWSTFILHRILAKQQYELRI